MLVTKTIAEIRKEIGKERSAGKKITLVPTMGALHDGHISLVKKARENSQTVIVSIFVNKTQFNDLGDYEKYPKTIESDIELLSSSGATHVFLPDSSEIFSDDFAFKITPTKFTDCLCGSTRPGHFDGVSLIVSKLFNIIQPDSAIFGEKDFQQLLIIKKLVEDLNFNLQIISHPTVRHVDGLAMSSRNKRLSETSRIRAAMIFKILNEIKDEITSSPEKIEIILQQKREALTKNGFGKIDYLEIRNQRSLDLITHLTNNEPARIFIAVYLDGVRLIDNLAL